ncbi:MAG: Crp/Fnr family transcriptional regulator [Sideroxydans sp.]|nr:Crp/Fnr family transcriptional regulator [Sideroxydans sp.]
MPHRHTLHQNRILAALTPQDLQEIIPHLEVIHLKAGEVLAESGKSLTHVCFPIDSAISLYYRLESGSSAGVVIIGNEGMFGVAQVLGGNTIPYWAVVETAGHVFQIEAKVLAKFSSSKEGLRNIFLLYAQASMTQISQTVVCEKHHSLTQKLCQHLLLISDKALADDFVLTHEAIANMLGVRRESVSEVASELRNQGLIAYNRGRIRVLDRAGLEKICCECYGVVKAEFTRLLGSPH